SGPSTPRGRASRRTGCMGAGSGASPGRVGAMPGIATPSIVRFPTRRPGAGPGGAGPGWSGDCCRDCCRDSVDVTGGRGLVAMPSIVLPRPCAAAFRGPGVGGGASGAAPNPSIVRFIASAGRTGGAAAPMGPIGAGATRARTGTDDAIPGAGGGAVALGSAGAGPTRVGTGAGFALAPGGAGTTETGGIVAAGVSAPHWPQNLARSGSGC